MATTAATKGLLPQPKECSKMSLQRCKYYFKAATENKALFIVTNRIGGSRLLITSTKRQDSEAAELKNKHKEARLFNPLPPRFIPAQFMEIASQCDCRVSSEKGV